MEGLLIAVEGIDGSGKTTFTFNLREWLHKQGCPVAAYSEPSNSYWGRLFRRKAARGDITLEEEVDLLIRDRCVDVTRNILPSLMAGKIVIMDRYYYSHVYQAARGIDIENLLFWNEMFAPKPHFTFLLDLPPRLAHERLSKRTALDVYEEVNFLQSVRELYLKIAKEREFIVLDAALSSEKILEMAVQHLTSKRRGSLCLEI